MISAGYVMINKFMINEYIFSKVSEVTNESYILAVYNDLWKIPKSYSTITVSRKVGRYDD